MSKMLKEFLKKITFDLQQTILYFNVMLVLQVCQGQWETVPANLTWSNFSWTNVNHLITTYYVHIFILDTFILQKKY